MQPRRPDLIPYIGVAEHDVMLQGEDSHYHLIQDAPTLYSIPSHPMSHLSAYSLNISPIYNIQQTLIPAWVHNHLKKQKTFHILICFSVNGLVWSNLQYDYMATFLIPKPHTAPIQSDTESTQLSFWSCIQCRGSCRPVRVPKQRLPLLLTTKLSEKGRNYLAPLLLVSPTIFQHIIAEIQAVVLSYQWYFIWVVLYWQASVV